MVDEARFLFRLGRLEADLAELSKRRGMSARELSSNLATRWSVERGLHVVIEGLLDLGEHILSSDFCIQTTTYRETAVRMAEKGIVRDAAATALPRLASFRNVLVHEYVRIDLEILARLLEEDIDALLLAARDIRNREWTKPAGA
ncbi:MAG: DUF86 domain-containing protein [Deltaproteobacteria bacterium]|nr:DUF86 domain-containing protein [Deltaproteobacteria bacterium]